MPTGKLSLEARIDLAAMSNQDLQDLSELRVHPAPHLPFDLCSLTQRGLCPHGQEQ